MFISCAREWAEVRPSLRAKQARCRTIPPSDRIPSSGRKPSRAGYDILPRNLTTELDPAWTHRNLARVLGLPVVRAYGVFLLSRVQAGRQPILQLILRLFCFARLVPSLISATVGPPGRLDARLSPLEMGDDIFSLTCARTLPISPYSRCYAFRSPVLIRPYHLVMLNNCFLGRNVTRVPTCRLRIVHSYVVQKIVAYSRLSMMSFKQRTLNNLHFGVAMNVSIGRLASPLIRAHHTF